MTMRTTDRLIAPPRSTLDQAKAYAARFRFPNGDALVNAYLTELYRLAPLLGLDPSIPVAQSVLETSEDGKPWDSFYWRTKVNPAGLGITGDPRENEQSRDFGTGTNAARAHVGHLLVYALGPSDAGSRWHRKAAGIDEPLSAVDPRYEAYLAAYGNVAKAETIAGLAGTWATDERYAEKIVARGNAIFPDLPDQTGGAVPDLDMTNGLIPLPPTIARIIDVSRRCTGDRRGWDDLGNRTIRGVVLHRSQGSWDGNIGHFASHCPGALTDLQVHHVDGRMMRFVRLADPPASIRSPSGWANGRVEGAYGDGKAFVDRYGVDAVNRDLESCEITGYFAQPGETTREDPVGDACWATLAQWIASRAHDYGIAWETFPAIPNEGNRSFVIWHQEFTIGTGKVCPGKAVMDGTPALIERTKAIMREAQTGAGETPTATTTPRPATATTTTTAGPPDLPAGMSTGLAGALFAPEGIVVDPDTGERAEFVRGDPVSEAWLRYVLTTGSGRWDGYRWPPLLNIVRRGDGRRVYLFGDGFVVEVTP